MGRNGKLRYPTRDFDAVDQWNAPSNDTIWRALAGKDRFDLNCQKLILVREIVFIRKRIAHVPVHELLSIRSCSDTQKKPDRVQFQERRQFR